MKKILIIGAANLIHTVNFIDTLLVGEEQYHITVFHTAYHKDLAPEHAAFYERHAIRILNTEGLNPSRNTKINAVVNFLRMGRTLGRSCRQEARYDLCFVLYCSWQSSLWTTAYHRHFSRVVPVYFGSDVLRNRRLTNCFYRRMNGLADRIVLPNLNTMKNFHERTKDAYRDKSYVIQYPTKMVQTMLSYQPLSDKRRDRAFFGLPADKTLVLCGHTATTAEQYEAMIDSLSGCRSETLQKCFFVFMMTYAPGDYREYQERIARLLEQSPLRGRVLTERIKYEDMPRLHYACDAHITTIKTDAFSCFLQEEMLAGNVLIYGKWLNYYEIENDRFFAFPIHTIEELGSTLDGVVEQMEQNAERSRINVEGIIALASEEAIRQEWERIVLRPSETIGEE